MHEHDHFHGSRDGGDCRGCRLAAAGASCAVTVAPIIDPVSEGVLMFGPGAVLSLRPDGGSPHGTLTHSPTADDWMGSGWGSAVSHARTLGLKPADDPAWITADGRSVYPLLST